LEIDSLLEAFRHRSEHGIGGCSDIAQRAAEVFLTSLKSLAILVGRRLDYSETLNVEP
jgi:hypothetical protein